MVVPWAWLLNVAAGVGLVKLKEEGRKEGMFG